MKKNILFSAALALISIQTIAQPVFTSADMPNIGDNDTVLFINYTGNINDLDTQTGSGFTWDFSSINFLPTIFNVDSFRVKTDPISAPYIDATIEEYKSGSSGEVVNLYDYRNDTLFIHRKGTAFVPPMPSIKFPIAFNQTSDITFPIYYGATVVGERRTTAYYDGFGTLQMPGNKTYSNVFRIKKIEKDTNYVLNSTTTYINYVWYKHGGQVPLLRITNAGGVNFIAHGSMSNSISTGLNENDYLSSIRIYPNPVNEVLNLQLSSDLKIQEIIVYNVLGEVVKSYQNKMQLINTKNLVPGTYFLKIKTEETSVIKPFIRK